MTAAYCGGMSRARKETAPVTIDTPIYSARVVELGDNFTVAFETIRADVDTSPVFRGLPGDRCPCPHWGLVVSGRMTMIYGDHDETWEAGDIARVAAHALVDPGHEGKTYVLTGGEAVSYAQVAATFSRVLGKPVKYVDMPPEQAKPAMLGMGLPAWLVDDLLTLSSVFAAGHGAQVTDAVEKVGKAKPRTIEQFVRDHAKAFT